MQGTVFGPVKCAVQMDKLGSLAYRRGTPLLLYKNTVQIPPLGMIDDLLVMDECSSSGIISNSIVNTFVESKRLSFGTKKCHKMHVGPPSTICPPMKVHENIMEESTSEKYIGDLITHNGSNTEHINISKNDMHTNNNNNRNKTQ